MLSKMKRKLKQLYYIKIKGMDPIAYAIQEMRSRGITIGENCRIFTDIRAREATLITIGSRVTVSSEVEFCTHDNAIIKAIPGKTDVVGPITIGDDCFIGMRSILMYGVTLGDHCVVGAGSVVTKSFPPRTVLAGNPAKAICTIDEYAEKYQDYAVNFKEIPLSEHPAFFESHPELMVRK